MNDLNDEGTEDPDGIPVNLLIGYFVPGGSGPAGQRSASGLEPPRMAR